jgi:thymidine kinase
MVPTIDALCLAEVDEIIDNYDVIGVDELQFFDDCVEYTHKWANNGKIIIWSGLDADSECRPFGRIHQMVPICEEIIKLKAVCKLCYNDASFTVRIGESKEIIDIGGSDKYISVCRKCRWKNTATTSVGAAEAGEI